MAEKRKELRVRSVEIAEGILVDEKERARFGRSGQANVLDAESALAQRRVQMLAADQNLFAVTGQLRNFIAGMPQDRKFKVDFSAMTEPGSIRFDRASMLANAYLYRPEYVAGLLRAEREDVRIQFAKNNKLPQLDLVASYGLNGLAESFGQSWDDVWDGDHESVYVGVEYRMALQGNKRGKGELSAARLRKHQALLEIKAAEIAIHNSVDTALNNLSSARMQVAELTGVVGTNKKLLDFELAKFEAGQSNSRDLFEIEERLNRVLELELESRVNLQKALIGAALSEGTLLQNFELEK
jgi:outer membrane protein TolC